VTPSTWPTSAECNAYVGTIKETTGVCGALNDDAGPALSACFPQTDADTLNFVTLFCGAGP